MPPIVKTALPEPSRSYPEVDFAQYSSYLASLPKLARFLNFNIGTVVASKPTQGIHVPCGLPHGFEVGLRGVVHRGGLRLRGAHGPRPGQASRSTRTESLRGECERVNVTNLFHSHNHN